MRVIAEIRHPLLRKALPDLSEERLNTVCVPRGHPAAELVGLFEHRRWQHQQAILYLVWEALADQERRRCPACGDKPLEGDPCDCDLADEAAREAALVEEQMRDASDDATTITCTDDDAL